MPTCTETFSCITPFLVVWGGESGAYTEAGHLTSFPDLAFNSYSLSQCWRILLTLWNHWAGDSQLSCRQGATPTEQSTSHAETPAGDLSS